MIKGKELQALLPQSSPVLMIDTLISSGKEKTITNLTITKENIFCENGKLRELGIIENMAQTAAARSGYEAKKNKTTVQTGYIGSIKNLAIFFLPKINEIIETKIVQKTEIGNILVIEANVKTKNKLVAKCDMTIILLENL